MSDLSHPSEATTIPDALYFAAEEAGRTPQTKKEAFVRAVTTGPVEQQLVNIAGELYDVGRKVDKLDIKVDKLEEKMDRRVDRLEEKVDRNHHEVMSLLRGFIAEMRVCIIAEKSFKFVLIW